MLMRGWAFNHTLNKITKGKEKFKTRRVGCGAFTRVKWMVFPLYKRPEITLAHIDSQMIDWVKYLAFFDNCNWVILTCEQSIIISLTIRPHCESSVRPVILKPFLLFLLFPHLSLILNSPVTILPPNCRQNKSKLCDIVCDQWSTPRPLQHGCSSLYISSSKIQRNTSDHYLNRVDFLMERSAVLPD